MESIQGADRSREENAGSRSLLADWFGAAGRERRAVLKALARLSDEKTPVRAEAEQTGLSFYTLLTLRRDALLIARPFDLRSGLPKNSHLRLTLPNLQRKQVRAQIRVPHLQMDRSAKHVCLCEVPVAFSGTCKRAADRLCTTQYKNVVLQLPSQNRSYRIVDLSPTGLRIYTGGDRNLSMFALDTELTPANLRIGAHTVIPLESVIARATADKTVGLAMQVQRDGLSERKLANLLGRLQLAELQRLRGGVQRP